MSENKFKRLPGDLYALVYGQYVPRLCVDVIVQGPNGIILAQRDIPPEIGSWHLPGGTVKKGETLLEAARRIVLFEAGVSIEVLDTVGAMEFLSEEQEVDVKGIKEKINVHSVSVVLLAKAETEVLVGSNDGKNVDWFTHVPPTGHTVHIPYLVKKGFLKIK